jgi:hypothetical protein
MQSSFLRIKEVNKLNEKTRPVEEGIPEAERKAHHEDTTKANKKIPLSEKTYQALKKKAETEGKTLDEKAAEIVEARAKEKPEEKSSSFPADTQINDYGFLHFKKAWLEELGWSNGMALKIEKNADGSITLWKA